MIQTRPSRGPDRTTLVPEPPSEQSEFSDTLTQTRLAPRDTAAPRSHHPPVVDLGHRISIVDLHAYYGATEAVKGSHDRVSVAAGLGDHRTLRVREVDTAAVHQSDA